MTLREYQAELDLGLRAYMRKNSLRLALVDGVCGIAEAFVEAAKPLGLLLLRIVLFPLLPIIYLPLIVLSYFDMRKKIANKIQEAEERMDRLTRKPRA